MDQQFPDEFVTWQHKTFIGVKVDEIFGMDSKNGRVWTELARQIYCETGNQDYRVIEHFDNGAPYLENYSGRISITHTSHLFAVATLPKTPEVNLEIFNPRSCMGIDAESTNREQVLRVREKFLSEEELQLIPADDLQTNILAWTIKEAIIKASLNSGINYKEDIKIIRLPNILQDPIKGNLRDLGDALLFLKETVPYEMKLFSYHSYGCIITIAITPQAAKFRKNAMIYLFIE